MVMMSFRYNNKTYRIDDISWDMNPTKKFKLRNGEEISFIQYYQKVCQSVSVVLGTANDVSPYLQAYDYRISDADQPLLLSRPKERDVRARGGDDSPILLIPELCTRTG